MNKAVTDGLDLMPPSFADGLSVWSKGDGTPASANWQGAPNAALVPSDPDFGACLEIQKTSALEYVRYKGETPILPGCYLRIKTRIKAMSGNLPNARIGGWAGSAGDTHVTGLTEQGALTTLTSYGDVVEISAIVGTGSRIGVDLQWGTTPVYGHFGIDFEGTTGGIIRIEDIQIEDVTHIFHRKMMDWVDVRDFGAKGDGITNDSAAFEAADAAANGRTVLVSEGVFKIGTSVSIDAPMRFEGTVTADDATQFIIRSKLDLDTYTAAFGNEVTGLKKAIQALFNSADHEALDLNGRSVELTEPLDVQAAVNNLSGYYIRRVIRNGQFAALGSSSWDTDTVTSNGTYATSNEYQLTNVTNISQIQVGSLVEGSGVGREVYVTSKNNGTGKITLSQPLYNAVGTQSYTFKRFKYMLDFSGFNELQKFILESIDFRCNSNASAIMLPPEGSLFRARMVDFTKPKDRGLTSIGTACQGMMLDTCNWVSSEISTDVPLRSTVCFNSNANDLKIRDCRSVRFKHTAVMCGAGHVFNGNHFFQGDEVTGGSRTGAIVFTQLNIKTLWTGMYLDNSFIEWTNEHDSAPDFSNEHTFGGLTVTGSIFTVNNSADWFRFIVIKPYGPGHYIHGLTVSDNVFKALNVRIDRVDKVDTSISTLDEGLYRNITFDGNSFNSVDQATISPVNLRFDRASVEANWVCDFGDYMPFGGNVRKVTNFLAQGPVYNASNAKVYTMPYIDFNYGPEKEQARINWSEPVRGTVHMTARCDEPT